MSAAEAVAQARDNLVELLLEGGYWPPEARPIVDAFAHALAEQIRSESYYEYVPDLGFSHQRDAWNDGRDVAADLIDPEVTK
ncbi:hypothetical protein [Streptomyces xanthophaeus]